MGAHGWAWAWVVGTRRAAGGDGGVVETKVGSASLGLARLGKAPGIKKNSRRLPQHSPLAGKGRCVAKKSSGGACVSLVCVSVCGGNKKMAGSLWSRYCAGAASAAARQSAAPSLCCRGRCHSHCPAALFRGTCYNGLRSSSHVGPDSPKALKHRSRAMVDHKHEQQSKRFRA